MILKGKGRESGQQEKLIVKGKGRRVVAGEIYCERKREESGRRRN